MAAREMARFKVLNVSGYWLDGGRGGVTYIPFERFGGEGRERGKEARDLSGCLLVVVRFSFCSWSTRWG